MEAGAVKQAFNNELIHLKKKLNQAKTQIIHKLTRKAKTFVQKKGSDELQAKFKNKATSIVNEVLILKKITVKELATFAITHKGNLKDFLNKPTINNERGCARLFLHKALNDKYSFLRESFAAMPLEKLLMTREETRKLKKDAKERKDKKRIKKGDTNDANWTVEDVPVSEVRVQLDDKSINNCESIEKNSSDNFEEVVNSETKTIDNPEILPHKLRNTKDNFKKGVSKSLEHDRRKTQMKKDRQINFNDKIKAKRLACEEVKAEEAKIMDPFFVTANGGNYMSLAQPRAPDEVKEEHKEGNRRQRRAAMFGKVPKHKVKKFFDNDQSNFNRNNYQDGKDNFVRNKINKDEVKPVNSKEEKLHPSWEAKKRMSSMLPFKGTKTVFE